MGEHPYKRPLCELKSATIAMAMLGCVVFGIAFGILILWNEENSCLASEKTLGVVNIPVLITNETYDCMLPADVSCVWHGGNSYCNVVEYCKEKD